MASTCPAGVRLTPLGSRLKVGETARIAWEPDKNTVGVLAVTVTRLRQGSLEDFDDFILDEQAEQSTPYYVDAEVENIGKSDLGGVDTPLYLVNGNDVLVRASTLQEQVRAVCCETAAQEVQAGGVHRGLPGLPRREPRHPAGRQLPAQAGVRARSSGPGP